MAARTGAALGSSELLTFFILLSSAGSIISLILFYRLNNAIIMRPAHAPLPVVPSGQLPNSPAGPISYTVPLQPKPAPKPSLAPPRQTTAYVPPPQPPAQHRMSLIFLLDTSASSVQYIHQLNSALNRFKGEVCQNPKAQSLLDTAIIQFSDSPVILQNLTSVGQMKPVRLIAGGNTHYSAPIMEALRIATNNPQNAHKPWVVFITGSQPADDISSVGREVKSLQDSDKMRFIALGTDGYNPATLKQLTDVVFRLDGNDFAAFFDLISKSIWAISESNPGEKPQLPPLQGNVYRDR